MIIKGLITLIRRKRTQPRETLKRKMERNWDNKSDTKKGAGNT